MRIGDAERDRAMAALGDHFAAGRLTKEEFDARVDEAMAARFDRDLQPLFADLPRAEPMASLPAGPPRLRAGWPILLWWLPLLLVGAVIVTVLLSAPWLIWTFCWVLFMGAFWGGRRRHHYRALTGSASKLRFLDGVAGALRQPTSTSISRLAAHGLGTAVLGGPGQQPGAPVDWLQHQTGHHVVVPWPGVDALDQSSSATSRFPHSLPSPDPLLR